MSHLFTWSGRTHKLYSAQPPGGAQLQLPCSGPVSMEGQDFTCIGFMSHT